MLTLGGAGKLAVLREKYRLSELAQLQRRLQQSEAAHSNNHGVPLNILVFTLY